MIRELRRAAESDAAYPNVLLVAQGTVEQTQELIDPFWSTVPVIADADHQLAQAFGIQQAGFTDMFSPGVVACGLRAVVKGNKQRKTVGDPKQMPGLFAIRDGRVIWQHDFKNVGDNPDFVAVPALISQHGSFGASFG